MAMFEPYETSERLVGSSHNAIDFASSVLTAAAFQIDKATETTLTASAPRRELELRRRFNQLLPNVMSIELHVRSGKLFARGELADYPVLQAILQSIFGLIGLGVIVRFARLKTGGIDLMGILLTVYLLNTLWRLRSFKRRAYRSIDLFARNIVTEAQENVAARPR